MISRRQLLTASGAVWTLSLLPIGLSANSRSIISDVYGDVPIEIGGVTLKTPSLAENGNSVSLIVEADSPMTPDNYIKEIRIFAPKNPEPELVTYKFGPGSGKASVSTRVRFADSQVITAVAQRNDGRLFSASSETIITLAACVEPLL
jgi:sulfur-oxidizing protein SoxY